MSNDRRARRLLATALLVAAASLAGCAVLRQTLSHRWIPDCGGLTHDDCCRETFGENYVCTDVRFNENGEPEIECSLRE